MTAGTRVFVVFTAVCGDHLAPPYSDSCGPGGSRLGGQISLNIAALRFLDTGQTALTETHDSDGSITFRSSDLRSLKSGPVFHFIGAREFGAAPTLTVLLNRLQHPLLSPSSLGVKRAVEMLRVACQRERRRKT